MWLDVKDGEVESDLLAGRHLDVVSAVSLNGVVGGPAGRVENTAAGEVIATANLEKDK